MLLINYTKNFSRTYWLPKFHHRSNKNGLWYFECCFLRVQVCLYSRDMGQKVLDVMEKSLCCPTD